MAKNIKRKMIHKELRNIGGLIRFFTGKPKIKKFIRQRKLQLRFFKGVNLNKKELLFKEIYINNTRVCVFEPIVRKENAVGLLWLHGGGFLNGIPEAEAEYFKKYIQETGCVVFAPDYTKSYDKPYPAALHEAYDTLLYMKEHTEEYSINPSQLFVAGVSAGGGLTAALTLYARDKGEVNVAFQMPLYPMLDDRKTNSNTNNDAPMWNSVSNELGWKSYLGNLYKTDNIPIYAAPARATDFSNLPPTLTFIGGIDPFRDETVNYINNLNDAGIETHFREYEGCFHAFEVVGFLKKVGKDANQFTLDGFKYAANNYFKEQK